MTAVIALLGRRGGPTCGVEDYCTWLGRALANRGRCLNQVRVPWQETGWLRALRWLWRESARWSGRWVILQYTALSWSRRGFPLSLLVVLTMLRLRSCRVAVVFHDASGFPGGRRIDWLRRTCQHWTMRRAHHLADLSILNVPLDLASWLPSNAARVVYIPVGANVPVSTRKGNTEIAGKGKKTVVVFGVTGGENSSREVADIARTVQRAAGTVPGLRLVVLGSGSKEAEGALRRALSGTNVELSVLGVLPAEDISSALAQADLLLFVRGPLSTQRTTGIAGIACGLPIVGYSGPHTGPPLTEAGVILVPYRDQEALAIVLTQVLSDTRLWRCLHQRTDRAYHRYFSWDVIAGQYVEALRL
jgi:glycosyltransferase involved in cell wall biosynthesis